MPSCEHVYISAQCLDYHAQDFCQIILDMVFEPRTEAAIEIEKLAFPVWSADHEHSLVMQTAFSDKTIGQNPLKAGDQAHINATVVNNFMAQRLTPENCLLVGSGIQNHSEFV